MIDFNFEENCYGCAACVEVCPKHAIKMVTNHEGFQVPKVDLSLCVNCGLCEKKCTFLSKQKSELNLNEAVCKAAFRKDVQKREQSASGGIAAVISEAFVEKENAVIGCAWSEELVARHILVNNKQDVFCLQGSKYVQSDMRGIYKNIRICLEKGKKCLFIGTPCQVGAVKNIFGNNDDLYTIGLICGGVASPKVWESFKAEQEKKYGGKMIRANFRSKGRYGWNTPVALYEFENGKKSEKLSFQLDAYVLQYLYGVFKRKSCYHCTYKGDSINADLILGDYWGSTEFRELSENMGVSAIICKTKKGEELVALLEQECKVIDTTLEAILHKNQPLIQSVGHFGDREGFFQCLDDKGYTYAARHCGGKTNPLKYIVMQVLDKTGLFELIKRRIKG